MASRHIFYMLAFLTATVMHAQTVGLECNNGEISKVYSPVTGCPDGWKITGYICAGSERRQDRPCQNPPVPPPPTPPPPPTSVPDDNVSSPEASGVPFWPREYSGRPNTSQVDLALGPGAAGNITFTSASGTQLACGGNKCSISASGAGTVEGFFESIAYLPTKVTVIFSSNPEAQQCKPYVASEKLEILPRDLPAFGTVFSPGPCEDSTLEISLENILGNSPSFWSSAGGEMPPGELWYGTLFSANDWSAEDPRALTANLGKLSSTTTVWTKIRSENSPLSGISMNADGSLTFHTGVSVSSVMLIKRPRLVEPLVVMQGNGTLTTGKQGFNMRLPAGCHDVLLSRTLPDGNNETFFVADAICSASTIELD